jgi:hypothetical protein
MKTNKQVINWVIDAGLLLGFLLAFFLNLTGLDVHQFLGVGLGIFAGYHLLRHWDWVRAVTAKFFSATSPRVLAFYTLDAALLLGFGVIIATGVAISSWLSLAGGVYTVWKNLHVYSSLITLALVMLKIGLHWRWIVKTAARLLPEGQPQLQPALARAAAPASSNISRRHFLTLMGVVGVSSWAAAGNVLSQDKVAQAATGTTTTTGSAATGSTITGFAAGTTSSATTTGCVLRCNKGCSYPGRCRRYTDSNKNGKCDLSECA